MFGCAVSHDSAWFEEGQFGFLLRDPEPFTKPIPAKGNRRKFKIAAQPRQPLPAPSSRSNSSRRTLAISAFVRPAASGLTVLYTSYPTRLSASEPLDRLRPRQVLHALDFLDHRRGFPPGHRQQSATVSPFPTIASRYARTSERSSSSTGTARVTASFLPVQMPHFPYNTSPHLVLYSTAPPLLYPGEPDTLVFPAVFTVSRMRTCRYLDTSAKPRAPQKKRSVLQPRRLQRCCTCRGEGALG